MVKAIINPANLNRPRGYAHGVRTEGERLLFLAGQMGVDASGQIAAPNDLVAQFAQVLSNLITVVEEARGQRTDIVKLTIYITDRAAYLSNLKPLGEAYQMVLGGYYPAMTLVEVKSLLDEEAVVEIDGMAVIEESS